MCLETIKSHAFPQKILQKKKRSVFHYLSYLANCPETNGAIFYVPVLQSTRLSGYSNGINFWPLILLRILACMQSPKLLPSKLQTPDTKTMVPCL